MNTRFFGETTLRAPDADGDGVDDALVAEPKRGWWPYGKAYILSGRTGLPLACWMEGARDPSGMNGLGSVSWFGGDVDGDATDDVVLSKPENGEVWIASGKRGTTLHELKLERGFCALALAPLRSPPGARVDQLLSAYPGNPGKLQAFSLAGELIRSIEVPVLDSTTACMSIGPDATGDGIDDIVVSGPELKATLVSGADLAPVSALKPPPGDAPAQVRLVANPGQDPQLQWLFPLAGRAIWTPVVSGEVLAEEQLAAWRMDEGNQPRARAFGASQQAAFLSGAAQVLPRDGNSSSSRALPTSAIWAVPTGAAWGAGENEIWHGYVGTKNQVTVPSTPVIIESFQCRMLDLPQPGESSSAAKELEVRLKTLASLLHEGRLTALGKIADPELGLRIWTTTGSVAQPSHIIDRHGNVRPIVPAPPSPEYLTHTWLRTVAELVDFGLEHLQVDQSSFLDTNSAVLRTNGQARFELAAELNAQTLNPHWANKALAQPISAELAVRKYDLLRVYLSTRHGLWYVAEIILNESDADPPED